MKRKNLFQKQTNPQTKGYNEHFKSFFNERVAFSYLRSTKDTSRTLFFLVLVIFSTACSTARIQSDYDDSIMSSKLLTYNFALPEEMNPDQEKDSQSIVFMRQTVEDQVKEEMSRLGFQHS
ncbi:hypothetical protein, partial [Xanthovirga aplysinae]|uniref:hypothetical protein n=1 Tax=Xanthovirga aplysinae TaxID=2529853 RepID=UPI0012BC3116